METSRELPVAHAHLPEFQAAFLPPAFASDRPAERSTPALLLERSLARRAALEALSNGASFKVLPALGGGGDSWLLDRGSAPKDAEASLACEKLASKQSVQSPAQSPQRLSLTSRPLHSRQTIAYLAGWEPTSRSWIADLNLDSLSMKTPHTCALCCHVLSHSILTLFASRDSD